MGGLCEEELLVGIEAGAGELAVAACGDALVAGAVGQAMGEHVFEVFEELGVGVAGGDAGGDGGALEESKDEGKAFLLACGDLEGERALAADHVEAAVVAEFRGKDVEAQPLSDGGRAGRGVAEVGADGEAGQVEAGVGHGALQAVEFADAKHELDGSLAGAVIEFDPAGDDRGEGEACGRARHAGRVGDRSKGREQAEAEAPRAGPPGIAGPAERAFVVGGLEHGEATRCDRVARVATGEGHFVRLRWAEEGEHLPERVGRVARAVADVHVLVAGTPQRLAKSARASDQSDTKAGEGSKRGVLSVKTGLKIGSAGGGHKGVSYFGVVKKMAQRVHDSINRIEFSRELLFLPSHESSTGCVGRHSEKGRGACDDRFAGFAQQPPPPGGDAHPHPRAGRVDGLCARPAAPGPCRVPGQHHGAEKSAHARLCDQLEQPLGLAEGDRPSRFLRGCAGPLQGAGLPARTLLAARARPDPWPHEPDPHRARHPRCDHRLPRA